MQNVQVYAELVQVAKDLGLSDIVYTMPSFTDRQRRLLLGACTGVIYTPQVIYLPACRASPAVCVHVATLTAHLCTRLSICSLVAYQPAAALAPAVRTCCSGGLT